MIEAIRKAFIKHRTTLQLSEADIASAAITYLGNGENNRIYQFTSGSHNLVIRISFRKELEERLRQEFLTLKELPEGIGPRPYIFDDSLDCLPHAFMIQSYIEGAHPIDWTVEQLEKHAKNLALLHGSKATPISGIDIKKLFEDKISIRKDDADIFDTDIANVVQRVKTHVNSCEPMFLELKHAYRIHGDLHDANILNNNSELTYVDWEESTQGDPAVDLGALFLSHPLTDDLYRTYIDEYQRHLLDVTLEARIPVWLLYKDFSLLLHKKWQSLDPSRSMSKEPEDYQKMIQAIIERMDACMSRSRKQIN